MVERVATSGNPLESAFHVNALEAIVQRFGRPPLLVGDGEVILEPLTDFPPDIGVKIKRVEAVVRSVGRVEFVNSTMSWGGTGSVVAAEGNARIVLTNRHVAKIVAKRGLDGRGVFLRSPSTGARYGAQVDFSDVMGRPSTAPIALVTSIDYLAEDMAADVALLRISAETVLPDPVAVSDKPAALNDLVAVIGYPAYDSRNDSNDQARYFKDLYEVKRFAPGKITQAQSASAILQHDCTTLGGSSGSPVISLETGDIVGLHFSGIYGKENSAVGAATIAALLRGERPLVTVPSGPPERPDGKHAPTELADRSGYVPGFLGDGLEAPWPSLPAEMEGDLAVPSDAQADRPHEIRYTHFGVKFLKSRKVPVMTGVNIDGGRSLRIKREGDRWFKDLRIPADLQLDQSNYDDAQIDRGHMVRREDPNWPASNPAEAERANFDTFHYTNAAPQHSALNQGKQQWQGLENYILDSSRTRGFRACVFTGPVLRDDDPDLDGVMVPLEFWKLVVMAGSSGLHATAYILSQGQMIREILERRSRTEAVEGFELGAYRTFQISVAELGKTLGYDFSAYEAADPLAQKTANEGAEALAVPVMELTDVSEIVL
jgi:endonuclease G